MSFTPTKNEVRRAQLAGLIGSVVQYYDYLLYGTLASLVFNKLFFPDLSDVWGLLASLATFGIPYFFRPVGSIIFSHMGDKHGRKATLILTILIMGISTSLIGALPTATTAGVWAPILLVTLRVIQGVAVGGEWDGSALVASEYSKDNKAFGSSVALIGASVGLLLASATVTLITLLPEESLLNWGWRVPFIGSIILVAIGYWIRAGLDETPEFKEAQEQEDVVKIPFFYVMKHQWKDVVLGALAKGLEGAPYYLYATFVIAFAVNYENMSESSVTLAITCGTFASAIFIPIWAKMADKVGIKLMFNVAGIATIVFIFPYFMLLTQQSVPLMFMAVILSWIVYAIAGGTLGGLLIEMFDANVRFTGISLGYQVGAAIFDGLTPLIAVGLLQWIGHWLPVAFYLVLIAIGAMISTVFMGKTKVKSNAKSAVSAE